MKGLKTIFSHKSVDYITPQSLFQPLREAFGIRLDPCAHDNHVLDTDIRSITKGENGLLFDWDLNAYINPPYSEIGVWVEKAIEQSCEHPDNFYVLLLPSRTDREWFRKVMKKAVAVCFFERRIKFANASNNAPFPSILAVITCKGKLTDTQFWLLESLGYVV